MNSCFVGFDTSNYTTSAAVVSYDGEVLDSFRIPLDVRDGERGLRQSDAVFAHIKNLPQICGMLREALRGMEIIAVGVSSKPRNAPDSYMPCFLSGVSAAEAFSAAHGAPLYRFSHQNGHIRAAAYSSHFGECMGGPFIAFHVSGGTTEALYVTKENGELTPVLKGYTADINAGQAIDRAGVAMGMKFPCGPELEAAALAFTGNIPTPRISVKNAVCNLSGLENLSATLWKDSGDRGLVGAYVFEFIAQTLRAMTEQVIAIVGQPDIPVLYAGGVMSNSIIKKRLSGRDNVFFAQPCFSADNAAGCALLCRDRYLTENTE